MINMTKYLYQCCRFRPRNITSSNCRLSTLCVSNRYEIGHNAVLMLYFI